MPNKALSDHVKRQQQSRNKEETMAKAVEAYTAEQAKTSSQKGARTIVREYGIENQWRTIVNRYDGGRSIHDTHKDQQKLSGTEESILVDFLHWTLKGPRP